MRRELFVFQTLQVHYWNIRKFLILWLKSAIFVEYIFLFFGLGSALMKFFILRARKSYFVKHLSSIFPECKKSFFWETIRNFFEVCVSWNIRKAFFWENVRKAFFFKIYFETFFWEFFSVFVSWNIRIFLILEQGISRNIRELGLKIAPGSPIM